MRSIFLSALVLLFFTLTAVGQTYNYVNGTFDISIRAFNPCGATPNNGYLDITVNSADGGQANLIFLDGPAGNDIAGVLIPVGNTFTFNASKTLPSGTYQIIIRDISGNFTINTFVDPAYPPIVLTNLPTMSLSQDILTNNTSCVAPTTGQIQSTISGGSQILAGGGSYTYSWSADNGLAGLPTNVVTNGATPLNLATQMGVPGVPGGTYTLSVIDNFSNPTCVVSRVFTITDPSPTVQTITTATPLALCAGNNITITLNNSEAAVTYTILSNGTPTAFTFVGTATGAFPMTFPSTTFANNDVIQVRATNGFCSPATMSGSVVLNINPLPTITGLSAAPVCQGVTTTNLTYTSTTGSPNRYSIDFDGAAQTAGFIDITNAVLTTSPLAIPVPAGAGAGTYNATITVSNTTTGCGSTTVPISFTVNPRPVPTLGGSLTSCVGATNVVYTTDPTQANYVWAVSAGGTITAGGGATNNSVTVTWNTAGAQTVSVNYTNTFGCVATTPTTVNVNVTPLPVPTLTGPTSVCQNTAGNFYQTEGGMSNYVWTVSAGGTITAGGTTASNSVTVTWTTTGPKTVSVSYTSAGGCVAATPTVSNITVNPLPTPTLGGTATVCAATAGLIYTTELGQSNYVWTVSAGGTITGGGTATSNTVTVTWNTAGAQTVSVNYDNAFGCDAATPTVFNVTVNPQPVPTLTGPAAACVGSTGNVYQTDPGMTNYVWTVSAGGTITADGGATNNSVTVTWNTAGARTVSVSYTNGNGCLPATPTVQNVTVNAVPVPTLTGTASLCAGTTGVIYNTDPSQSNYVWTVSAGGTITAGGTATSSSVTVTWNTAGAQSVSVNYANASGCSAAAPTVLNVTVNPAPSPTLNGPITACVGTTNAIYQTELGQSAYVWNVSAGGTITAGGTATDNSVNVTWTTAGAQTVSVNYNNASGCAASTATVRNVTVNALPNVTFTTAPATACVGATGNVYTTQPGQTNYVWAVSPGGTITAGGTATSNTVTVTWTTAGPQTVSVNYTNAAGCTATTPATANVTVNPIPTPTLNGPVSVCRFETATYFTEPSQTNYNWTISTGATVTAGGTPADNSVTVIWNAVGARTIRVNYTNASGCAAPAQTILNVTVNALPTVTFTGGPTTACVGSTGNVYTTQAGQTNYVWAVSAGGTITAGGGATNNSVTVTWGTAGAQTVSVSYTNANGCSPTTPVVRNVTVNPLPVPALTGPTTSCVGATGAFYQTDPGQTNYVWTVSAGGTITAGGTTASPSVTVTWATAGPKTVSVSYTNASGCTASTPTVLNVNVNPVPTPSLTGTTTVCAGTTNMLYQTDPGQTNYVWTVSGGGTITAGGTATDNSVTVTWGTAGPQTVTVNYTSALGCAAPTPTSLGVTVNALPVPSLAGPTAVCIGSTGIVYATDPLQTNYVWTVSAGGTITTGGGPTNNSVTVSWLTAGAQSVSVSYTDANGCTAAVPTSLNVNVNNVLVPTLAGSTAECVGATSVIYSTDLGQTNYIWTVSAGGTITAGGTATDPDVTVTWTTAGPQTVSVTYTDVNGCAVPAPTVLNVTIGTIPAPALTGAITVCEGTTNVVYSTDLGQTNYVWTVSPGGTITSGGTATDDDVTVTWTTPGPQTVTVNYTTASGCTAATPTSLGVTVNALPTPGLTGSTSVCVGTTGAIYSTDAGQTNYVWTVSAGGTITAGGTATDEDVTITWATAGPQTVSVSYTDVNGCTAAAPTVVNVNVTTILVPTLNGPTTVCAGATGSIYASDPGQTNYVWTVSAGGTITAGGTATDEDVTITWTTAGPQTVSVTYTDVNGCAVPTPTVRNVTVGTIPTPALTGSTSECVGATSIVYATDAGQTNYVWTVSAGGTITAGGTATDEDVTITWNTAGPQTVSVNYTSSGCAAATPTVLNVAVSALPVPTITGASSACIGTTNVVYFTEPGQTNYIWTVSAGGTITAGGTATDEDITITWTTAGPQTVTVNYTNANGCTATTATSRNVAVNAIPVPTINGLTTVCEGPTDILYETESGQTNYVWAVSAGGTITAGGTATDNTITIQWTTDGPQTVSVNYSDANGCTAATPVVVNVTVNPVPVPTITGTTTLCSGPTGILYETELGQTNYVWTVSAGGTITAGGTATDNTVRVAWATAGARTVSVNYENAFGCPATSATVLNVTVNDTPTATITGTATVCVGQPGVLTVTLTGGGPWDIVYTDGSSNFPQNGITTNIATITVNPIITTTYTLVSVSNASCGAGTVSGTATLTVNPIPGNPAVFGNETWLGYVYDDSGDLATPLPGRINFAASKYRGFIDATDINNMSGSSTYNVVTDTFDLNPGNGNVFGPNVCGTYADDYSIRLRMQKTFAAGIYNFSVGSDDGVRLLIDGVNVIPAGAFATHAYSVFQSGGICLSAGMHDVVIEYFERGTFSRLSFDYQLAPLPDALDATVCVNTPTAPTLTATSTDPGVTGFRWYTDAALTTLVSTTASYTPAAADLDLSVAGVTDFFVTAVYACGQTAATQVDVNVVNAATLTLSDAQVCEAGGIVDLTSLVSVTPAGGTFTFAGTNVSGSNFDPTGLSGTSVTITVDYTIGTCSAPQGTFDIDVTNSSTITVADAEIEACESGADIDLRTNVTGNPAGGTFTFSGPGVTGNMFDPSTLSGIQTITVNYTTAGCPATPVTFDINVSPNASITIGTNPPACQNGGTINLLGRVSGSPGGGTFTFSGTGVTGNTFDPTGLTGPVNITVTYTVTGCSVATLPLTITVLDPSNPACGGGGINCSVFTVNATSVRPSCSDQDDGSITLIVGGGNTSNKIIQLIKPNGVSFDTTTYIGPSGTYVFAGLSPANYQYLIRDFAGNICKQPFSLPLQTIVDATADPSSFVDVFCFGEPTGQAIINATGSQTGQYFFSITGTPSDWTLFVPGNIINTLPPNGTYTILVGESPNDACRDTVQVTINNVNPAITATYTITDATCNGSDGSISNIVPAGGSGGPFEFSLDGVTFQTANSFDNRSGGLDTLYIRDASGCTGSVPFNITFPGFVDFTAVKSDADCSNQGRSGIINVFINDIGSFRMAISDDPFNEPDDADYKQYFDPSTPFNNLPRGQYFVYVKSDAAACPTRSAPIDIGGTYAITFDIEQGCDNGNSSPNVNEPFLVLSNITGEPNLPVTIEVYKKFESVPFETITLPLIPATASVKFDYDTYVFMQTPGDYELILSQTSLSAGCPMISDKTSYTVPRQLFAAVGTRSESYPDIPTGKLQIRNFDGGITAYDIRIELDSASSFELPSFETDFEEVGLNANSQFEMNYENIPAGRYKVQVIDSVGCFIEITARVPLDTDIFIPNIFTPNEDGANDVFFIRNLPTPGAKLIVTNRWGKQVFTSNDYKNDWKGEGLADGVYFYQLQGSDSPTVNGWVEILRGEKP